MASHAGREVTMADKIPPTISETLALIDAQMRKIEETGKAPQEVRSIAVAISLLTSIVSGQERRLTHIEESLGVK